MASLWQRKLYKTHKVADSTDKLPWKEAKLTRPLDDNLNAQWCVTYYVWSYDKDALVRKRVLLLAPSIEQRLIDAALVIEETNAYLKDGRAYVGTKPEQAKPVLRPAPKVIADELVVSPKLPVQRAVTDYVAYTNKTFNYNTFKSYRNAVMSLWDYLERHQRGQLTLGEFSRVDATQYLKELITVVGVSSRTRNNMAGFLCTFFNHYIELDRSGKLKREGNPFADIGKLPQVKHKHQSYSLRQQQDYRQACADLELNYLLTFCRWMYYTLMRPHEELRRLRVRDLGTYTIYVSGDSAKDNEGEYVDIPLPLEQLIHEQKIRDYPGHYFVFSAAGQPGPDMVGPKYFYRRHVQVLERINLTDSGHDMYSWKHTGAIALWNATKDIELIRNQARHSDIKQTIEYLRDLGIRLANDDKIHKFPVF